MFSFPKLVEPFGESCLWGFLSTLTLSEGAQTELSLLTRQLIPIKAAGWFIPGPLLVLGTENMSCPQRPTVWVTPQLKGRVYQRVQGTGPCMHRTASDNSWGTWGYGLVGTEVLVWVVRDEYKSRRWGRKYV